MKLQVGKFIIETDYIEMIERLSDHTVKLFFVSGEILDVVYGIKTTSAATWDEDADAFIQTLQNIDVEKPDTIAFKKNQ